jgi:hypothetical protein
MTIHLPEPVAVYFNADGGGEDVSRYFANHAMVKDEGHTYSGLASIGQWKTDSAKKYAYRGEPFACEDMNGRTIVTSRVTGNFPGSAVDLRYFFRLAANKIAALEIPL